MSKEDDHGFYLFKTLGFDAGKGKFDTKGYGITGVPEAKEDTDLINKKHLDDKVLPIEKDVKRIGELQRHVSEDVVALSAKIDELKISGGAMTKVETYIEPVIESLASVKNSMLKEVTYEIMVKKNAHGKFLTPLRLLDNAFHKHSLASINIYKNIELLHIGTHVKFLNSKNNEIHIPSFKTKKKLKTPIDITIKKKKEGGLEPSNILYSYTVNKIKTHKNISPIINLDNKFQDKIIIRPENMESCFINTSEEAKYPEVRVIIPEVENIKLSILFLLRLTYVTGDAESDLPEVSEDYDYIETTGRALPSLPPPVSKPKTSSGCPAGHIRVGGVCVSEEDMEA